VNEKSLAIACSAARSVAPSCTPLTRGHPSVSHDDDAPGSLSVPGEL
jgi:hypothetical protein